MAYMKNIKILLLGVFVFWGGYYSHSFINRIDYSTLYRSSSATSSADFYSDNRYQCQLRISSLESRLKVMSNEISYFNAPLEKDTKTNITPVAAQKSLSPPTDANVEELATLRQYIAENEIKKHENYLHSINATPENMSNALNDNFNKDTLDAHWATEKRAVIDSFISKNKVLNSLPNVETECKSKQCKISILSDDPNALQQLSQSITELTAENNNFSSYTYAIDSANHITSIFLDRHLE